MRSLISKAFAATLLLVSLVTAFADDDLEEFEEVVEEIFEELDEELDELLDQFRDSDEDFNELVEEFDEEFDDEFHELAEELQELATPPERADHHRSAILNADFQSQESQNGQDSYS